MIGNAGQTRFMLTRFLLNLDGQELKANPKRDGLLWIFGALKLVGVLTGRR